MARTPAPPPPLPLCPLSLAARRPTGIQILGSSPCATSTAAAATSSHPGQSVASAQARPSLTLGIRGRFRRARTPKQDPVGPARGRGDWGGARDDGDRGCAIPVHRGHAEVRQEAMVGGLVGGLVGLPSRSHEWCFRSLFLWPTYVVKGDPFREVPRKTMRL